MTSDDIGRALAQVPLFAGLEEESIRSIAAIAGEAQFPAGAVLIEARTPGTGLYVLLEGTAEVEPHGRPVRILGAGDVFGELALFTPSGMRLARVIARTPVRCLAVAREDFRAFLEHEPKVAIRLLETIAARFPEEETEAAGGLSRPSGGSS
jgi:CRP-like cAMP-binding protein